MVARGGLPYLSPSFVALAAGIFLAVALVLVVGGYIAYDTVIRPGNLVGDTRYLITDKRVLIQRRGEELHVDRSKIVDVIDAPAGDGLRNVFMVLDGPQARALAASGAFGELERSPHLRRCSKPSKTPKARDACWARARSYRTPRESCVAPERVLSFASASRQRCSWRRAFGRKRSFAASAAGKYCSQLATRRLA